MGFDSRIVSRRALVQAAALAASWAVLDRRPGLGQTPESLPGELVIDMAGGPDNLDPALARSVRDWSIVHSIYDSILDLGTDGSLVPLAAERFEILDDVTFEVTLRMGMTFHDGTPVQAEAIGRSITYVQQSEGPAARNFQAIDRVEVMDDLTARIVTLQPAPWLPSQL
ncbi:MAG: ABC transporter substrate-binding protein, partial [Thermomicrobiales bacterium]